MLQVTRIRHGILTPAEQPRELTAADRQVLAENHKRRLAEIVSKQCAQALKHVQNHKVRGGSPFSFKFCPYTLALPSYIICLCKYALGARLRGKRDCALPAHIGLSCCAALYMWLCQLSCPCNVVRCGRSSINGYQGVQACVQVDRQSDSVGISDMCSGHFPLMSLWS